MSAFNHLRWISGEYYDLNGAHIEILQQPPSALEFSRLVHISRPVIIRGFEIPATKLWTDEYLINKMSRRSISVAITPNGRADAVTRHTNGLLYFVEPFVDEIPFEDFLAKVNANAGEGKLTADEIHYLQSQNGNLFTTASFEPDSDPQQDVSEFEPLRTDVPNQVDWCSEALGRPPDAVNLWIGNSKSVTSIHSDPYENIYTVVRGEKHFTVLPPTEAWCLQERWYPHAMYTRPSSTSPLVLTPSAPDSHPRVRWSSIHDPHIPGQLPPCAHPIHITVRAGEMLYLPAGWWHYVRQSAETTIAINWWYDIESRGSAWVWLNFLRGAGRDEDDIPDGNIHA